ncbi:two-component system, NarL family, sensor histidine kinase DesK [Amycolatopsis arida]|uniref:Two-component system, NarL family, sensor histidine kinase DesK n=1 Tax=Amycolatopsis arida TaxID=587909 RepID=A0A1I5YFF0_9PSEU|nr:histidine kinase [Amycolatopsis arida]TDX90478.1 two-component system sensor histidine kinase DesK [Amycolatopsis arida]SFQ42965.1 two-component system, NarL family, sensor histidine kinase DesK [Amycolatopsis arida]
MRAYTWWSLVAMSSLALAPVGFGIANDELRPPGLPVLVVAAVGAAALRIRFVHQAMRGLPRLPRPRAEHLAGIAGTELVWGYVVLTQPVPGWWMFLPAVVGGAVVLNLVTSARWWTAAGLMLATALTGAVAAAVGTNDPLNPVIAMLAGALVVGVFVALDVVQLWFWDVVAEVDRARATAAELAVARERLRFAAELHDVQGHHLQAIMLKGEFTERLIGRDDAAARQQAAELTELARTALTETRKVVHGYRTTTLTAEVTNAVDILRAAGIAAEVHGSAADVPPPLQQLFGALVREGTTNVLRHSKAQHCVLTMESAGGWARVRLANDGPTGSPDGGGSGIASLRERFATLGGRVRAGRTDDGWFELVGAAPEPGEERR